jgi:hypothetical protein
LSRLRAVGSDPRISYDEKLLLGHTKIESTVRYLDVDDAQAIAEQVDV